MPIYCSLSKIIIAIALLNGQPLLIIHVHVTTLHLMSTGTLRFTFSLTVNVLNKLQKLQLPLRLYVNKLRNAVLNYIVASVGHI